MSEVDETLTETDLPSVATEGGVRRSIKFDVLQSAALITFVRRRLLVLRRVNVSRSIPGAKARLRGLP